METKPFTEIRLRYHLLSKDQKKVADYILTHMSECVLMTISDLAVHCNLSETTVIRFINKLGYKSYQVFRVDMVKELSELKSGQTGDVLKIEDGYQDINAADAIEEIKRKVIRSAMQAIGDMERLVDTAQLEHVVETLMYSDQIMFYGAGGSNVIAMDAHHKFMRLGLNSIYESNSHFALIRSKHLGKLDMIFLFSHTGESFEVLDCARNARANGCTVVGITSYMNSSLANQSDILLFSSTNDLQYYTDAMVSRLLQIIIVDLIFVSLSVRLGTKSKEAIAISRYAVESVKSMSRDKMKQE